MPQMFNPVLASSGGTSGGGGSKNYLAAITTSNGSNTGNGDFETGLTTGFTLGTIGTLTNAIPTGTPTFGSGAAGTLSLAIVSSGQLAGSKSLSYVSSAATTVGNMFASDAFNIDNEDQAKVLTWKIYYKAFSGSANCNFSGTSSNSFGVAFYDVTNSSWLGNSGQFGIVQGTGIGYATGTFQTNVTTTSIRMCIYNVNATSGAVTMYFDDLQCGPQTAPFGPVIADAKTFTPTGNWVTNTTYSGYYTRIGDRAFIEVQAALSGAPTGTFTVNMPPGLVIDSTKMTAALNNLLDNSQARVVAAGQGYIGSVTWQSSTSVGVVSMAGAVSTNAYVVTTATVPATFANGDVVQISFSVPIVGWSSNAVQSNDTITRVVATSVTATTGVSVSANSPIIYPTVVYDKTGSYNNATGVFTVPVSGIYRVAVTSNITVAAANVYLNKNGSNYAYITNIPGTALVSGAIDVSCNAGDTLSVNLDASKTLTASTPAANTASFSLIDGPAVVQATESVNALYTDTSGASIPSSLGTYTYPTKVKDSHNAMSGSTYTIPVSGQYRIAATLFTTAVTQAVGGAFELFIYRNGTQIAAQFIYGNGGVSVVYNNTATVSYPCSAGDTIQVKTLSSTVTTANTSAGSNNFCIERVGN